MISAAWPLSLTIADQGESDVATAATVLSPTALLSSAEGALDVNNNHAGSDVMKGVEQAEDRGGDPSPSTVPLSHSPSAAVGRPTANSAEYSGSAAALSGDEQACGGAAPTAGPSSPPPQQPTSSRLRGAPCITPDQVASTVSILMEAHPAAGPVELSAWTARVLGLSIDSTPDDLMLVNGIVVGIVLCERMATSRQLNLAQIAMQTDPYSLISGAFHALHADISLRNSRPLGPAGSYARFWQAPNLLALDLPETSDDANE